ncbi:MAG: hypothetical protein LUD72_11605 [Bacteroidales bacterium]|nr:hypothetical protein [Bacteroidales bacterium]
MSSSGKEKKRNVWRTALAVFVATLILCGVFLLVFSSGDSFGRYTATQDVHGTFSHEVTWTLLNQSVVDDITTMYETDDNGERVTDENGNPVVVDGPTRNLTLTNEAYHLEGDVTADITVPSGTEVTLCLNGYVLQGLASENDTTDSTGNPVGFTAGNPAITVAGGGTLHLCDCNSTDQTHNYSVNDDSGIGYLIENENDFGDSIKGGVVTGGRSCDGGGIFVQSGGTMTMNSGTIFGNAAIYDKNENQDDGSNFTGRGGGVCVLGSLEMSGGIIQHNTAECDGAGLYVYDGATGEEKYAASEDGSDNGSFVMKGNAKVAFNRCIDDEVEYGGGGVFLESGTFSMSGESSVCDNQTYGYGGGVLIEGLDGKDAVFTMSEEASLKENSAGGPGGAVYMYGDDAKLVMNDSADISSNIASSSGGGIFVYRGTFEMNGGSVNDNTATTKMDGDGGGGVFVDGKSHLESVNDFAVFVMRDGEINNNKSGRDAGGVKVDCGTFTMHGGSIDGNNANYNGGAVHIGYAFGTFTMSGGEICNNYASGLGGAVCINNGTFTMSGEDSEIGYNTSGGGGAGVYINSSDAKFEMSGGMIVGNDNSGGGTSGNSGGGVYLNSGTFEMSGGEISENKTMWGGAGVYIWRSNTSNSDYGVFTMTDGDIHDNSNTHGSGPGVFVYIGTFNMEGGYIRDNVAMGTDAYGGGLYVDQSSAQFNLCGGEISGNESYASGGGVYVANGTLKMSGGSIISNATSGAGGGVYVASGTFEMSGGEISLNTASGNGGGVYSKATFNLTGGTIGGFETDGGEIVSLGNTAENGGGIYIYSGTFSIEDPAEVCYNSAKNTCGGIYYNSSGTISDRNVYKNDPDNVSGTSTSHSYPDPANKNIDSFVVWDWDDKTEYIGGVDESGNLGKVHVSINCPCGEYNYFDGYVEYTMDEGHNALTHAEYVWYYYAAYDAYAEISGEVYTYTSTYRNPEAADAVSYLSPTVAEWNGDDETPYGGDQEVDTPNPVVIEKNDLFVLNAIEEIAYYGGISSDLAYGEVSIRGTNYTDMYGTVQYPDMGMVTGSNELAGDGGTNENIISITAYDDIEVYVYVTLSNHSFNSNRSGGRILYTVYDVDGEEVVSSESIELPSDRRDVVTVSLELMTGQTLVVGAENLHSSTARLWFFGAEAYALNGAGIFNTVSDEERVTKIELYDIFGNEIEEGNTITVSVGADFETITVRAYMDEEIYEGSRFTWSADDYHYVAYNADVGTLSLMGIAVSAKDTNGDYIPTTINVSVGGVETYFCVIVTENTSDDTVWSEVTEVDFANGFVDFADGFTEKKYVDKGDVCDPVEITKSDGTGTGFFAVASDSSSTAIEIASDTVGGSTYLKFNGSASITKGSIKYHLSAGEYKIEIRYFNTNAGRYAIVMNDNGEKLGDDVCDSQKTTTDGAEHTRIITFTLDEEMDIYIGSESSGLFVTYIRIDKIPGYDADVTFINTSDISIESLEIVLDENSGIGTFTVNVEMKYDEGVEDYDGVYSVKVESNNEAIATVTVSGTDVMVKGIEKGVTTLSVKIYVGEDNDILVKTSELTVVVKKTSDDTVETSYLIPFAGEGEESLDGTFAEGKTIDDNYLFTITNGSAHEMQYTVGAEYGNISGSIAYVDMRGQLITPDQALYTERNIEDSDDILRFTAKDDIYLYVYVALADTKFGSDRAGNVIYYYICDSVGNYAKDEYGNIIYDGSYTVSSLADMWTIAVYLKEGETLVIGYTAASGTNSTLYFFGAEARTYNAKYDVDIEISIDNDIVESDTNRLELTIYDNEYLEEHTVDGEIVDVDFSVMTGTIEIGDITILDVTDDSSKSDVTETKGYEVVVEIVGNGVAKIDYDVDNDEYSVTATGKGVTYVMIAVKVDGVVVAMEKIEVVVTVYEESEEKSGEGDGTDIDDGTVNP